MELFGWHKDKFDSRDYLHRRRFITLPDKISLAHLLTPIRDQGNVGSCVGHGIGINLNSIKKRLGIYEEWCSPTYIYNGARYLEGTLPFDLGCYPKDALDWTVDYGILLEHLWPYDQTKVDTSAPSSERIEQADRYKDFAYFRCVDGIDGICDAMASGFFVSIGSPWFDEWRSTDNEGKLAIPTNDSSEAGGHETCFYEYDRQTGFFKGANSWSIKWGNEGSYFMPFESIDEFKRRGGYDAHYITFTEDIDDDPVDPPSPSPCPVGKALAKLANTLPILLNRKGRFYYRNP